MYVKSCRSLMLAVAMIALAAVFHAPELRAQSECCGFGIANNTNCSFRVTLVVAAGERTFIIPPGGSSESIPGCVPFRLKVRDACGVEHYLPQTIGDCIRVYFGTDCCLVICKVSDCRWSADYGHCIPC